MELCAALRVIYRIVKTKVTVYNRGNERREIVYASVLWWRNGQARAAGIRPTEHVCNTMVQI